MKSSNAKKSETVLKPIEFEVTLRVGTNYLSGPSSRVYRDQIGLKICEVLASYFEIYALNLALPELVLPVTVAIKRWLKKHGGGCGGKIRHALQNLVEKLDEQAKWVEEKRRGMAFNPEMLSAGQHVTVSGCDVSPLTKWIQKQKAMQE
jgi:nucleolar complex protein 2